MSRLLPAPKKTAWPPSPQKNKSTSCGRARRRNRDKQRNSQSNTQTRTQRTRDASRQRREQQKEDLCEAILAAADLFLEHGYEGFSLRQVAEQIGVAMETATASPRLNLACREAFDRLEGAFAAKLAASGYEPQRAAHLATFITAAIEGGILLSRTYHTGDPLRRVGQELAVLLQQK